MACVLHLLSTNIVVYLYLCCFFHVPFENNVVCSCMKFFFSLQQNKEERPVNLYHLLPNLYSFLVICGLVHSIPNISIVIQTCNNKHIFCNKMENNTRK